MMFAQLCKYAKKQCNVYFKGVNFTVPELHLIKKPKQSWVLFH